MAFPDPALAVLTARKLAGIHRHRFARVALALPDAFHPDRDRVVAAQDLQVLHECPQGGLFFDHDHAATTLTTTTIGIPKQRHDISPQENG
jgi:hypothetical protein